MGEEEAKARLAGSRRGSARVQSAFEGHLTRRRVCILIGIHSTTLRRWERAAILVPVEQHILGIPTWVFSEADVALGRRIKRLLDANPGTMSAAEAAKLAHETGR